MKKAENTEEPLLVTERSVTLMSVLVLTSAAMAALTWSLLASMNPWGFFLAIPSVILVFQTAWLLLNPFAMVFHNHIEIRQSWFHQKERYFIDLTKVTDARRDLAVQYTDGEIEKISLFGMRQSHKARLKEHCGERILRAEENRNRAR